jgi:hypothetical protein
LFFKDNQNFFFFQTAKKKDSPLHKEPKSEIEKVFEIFFCPPYQQHKQCRDMEVMMHFSPAQATNGTTSTHTAQRRSSLRTARSTPVHHCHTHRHTGTTTIHISPTMCLNCSNPPVLLSLSVAVLSDRW